MPTERVLDDADAAALTWISAAAPRIGYSEGSRRCAGGAGRAAARAPKSEPGPRGQVITMGTAGQVRDADIARRVRSALYERLGYVADALELDVHDGIVALAGDVESGNQKTVAEKIVGELAGVGAVENRVRIMPPSKLAMRTLLW